MGWTRQQLTPEILRCMSPQDQATYGPGIHPDYADDPHPPVKTDEPEKKIQHDFAAVCIELGWSMVWHGMHKRSTANRGCPDFIVGAYAQSFWIEFKKPGEDLSPDQKLFRSQLADNGITMYTCFSWREAVDLIEQHRPTPLDDIL
jgi:hypothetical protein